MDIAAADVFDSAYQPQQEYLRQLDDSTQVVSKYVARHQNESGATGPTTATSGRNYLTFEGDFSSPKAAFKISN
jgi:hypothetical protein